MIIFLGQQSYKYEAPSAPSMLDIYTNNGEWSAYGFSDPIYFSSWSDRPFYLLRNFVKESPHLMFALFFTPPVVTLYALKIQESNKNRKISAHRISEVQRTFNLELNRLLIQFEEGGAEEVAAAVGCNRVGSVLKTELNKLLLIETIRCENFRYCEASLREGRGICNEVRIIVNSELKQFLSDFISRAEKIYLHHPNNYKKDNDIKRIDEIYAFTNNLNRIASTEFKLFKMGMDLHRELQQLQTIGRPMPPGQFWYSSNEDVSITTVRSTASNEDEVADDDSLGYIHDEESESDNNESDEDSDDEIEFIYESHNTSTASNEEEEAVDGDTLGYNIHDEEESESDEEESESDEEESESDEDSDDEIEIIYESHNALIDYPHARSDCLKEVFGIGKDLRHCPNCFCKVCDMHVSSCIDWSRHCSYTE